MKKSILAVLLCLPLAACNQAHMQRVANAFAAQAEATKNSPYGGNWVSHNGGVKVYKESQCIGAVVAGECHGEVIPNGTEETCYGDILFGKCTGPQF